MGAVVKKLKIKGSEKGKVKTKELFFDSGALPSHLSGRMLLLIKNI